MQGIDNRNVYEPLVLTPWQRQVLEALRDKETEKYPLSEWYRGALYALDNPYNPDRISQAAQSLRELLEKLPRLIQGSDVQGGRSGFAEMRRSIYERILRDKKRHPEGWKDEKVDGHLDKTLRKIEDYLERNQQPTRRQQMQRAVATIDPMVNRLNSKIQETKRDLLLYLGERLEDFAHHSSKPAAEEFTTCLEKLERTVFDLLAPITAQDQREIQTILSCSDRSETNVERMFSLIERRGANFEFFFKSAAETADATWLPLLKDRAYFANPPNAEPIDDDWITFPFWWPIDYLAKIADRVPDEAIEIVRQLPEVDNSRIYYGILEVALRLHGEQSAELKQKILESTNINDDLLAFKYAGLLAHWVAENQTSAALELSKVLVKFAPDPQSESKQKRRRENPTPEAIWATSLEPSPRIGAPEYNEIMSSGVRPLAEKKPYEVACILTSATANMIRLRIYQEDSDRGEDLSEAWCKNLRELDKYYEDPNTRLVHTLTFACEQVYKKSPDLVVALDKVLRDKQWKLFKRLRQHLYAQYPNEQTKPWIREFILEHDEYHLWEHHYEFQQMIQSACEHFGETLLSEAEQARIFDSIYSGPSKEDFQEWQGEEFSKDKFLQRQRYFHRKQFKPFESVLFGKYATYFQELEAAADNDTISDEDYLQIKTIGGFVSHRSPRSPEDLAKLTDEELLAYINKWEEKEDFFEGDLWIEVSIKGLTEAFQTVFKDSIIPDANRLRFWLENRERIEKPIYVQMMISGMQAEVKEKNFDRLDEWLTFNEWVLSHPDQDDRLREESRENPNWSDSRRAVDDFIAVCLEEEVNVPVSAQGKLAKLLKMLCTQFDSRLDRGKRVLLNRDDPIIEGINNTRSSALETLVKFGFWLRRQDPEIEVSEVTTILEKRFASETEYPLTVPEYAILGRSYPWIFHLNKAWAAKDKSDFFPQDKLPAWLAAFGSLVCYSDPFKPTFEILRDDFDFALQHLTDFKKQDTPGKEPIDILGQHLFHYYLWEMYPLRGSVENNDCCALLEQFYQRTDGNREHWGYLFGYVGRIWKNTNEQPDKRLKDKTIAFFDWRFEVEEPTELQQFACWLEAEFLDPDWRLDAYYKILKVCKIEGISIARQIEALCKMLPDHTTKVFECFVKLTDGIKDNNIYILAEEAKTILRAGLNSSDKKMRQKAKHVHEKLLREGRSDLLDLDD